MEIFKLIGKLSIEGIPAAESAMSKVGGAAKAMGAAVAAGVTAAGAALTKMAKDAVDSYAEYEQLVGGVETLFKDSAGKVQEYAQSAFQTAGLSANEYMSTVTSFSASLLQSLDGDTAQAAEMANMAITDMADNANKMGTSIDMIQNAYQGFAKQNYTMLDNLKLGYGGTATEMARLINDSGVLGDAMIDLGDKQNIGAALAEVGFDKMVEAIHVVQTEMGITGTTAKEASSTIQGSAASMKSAWQNLLTGMADENQNLDKLLAEFLTSVETFGNNLIPRIEKLLPRLVSAASNLVTNLAGRLPDIIEKLLPVIIQGAVNLVSVLISNFPALTKSIITAAVNGLKAGFPAIKEAGLNLVQGLWNGISSAKDWVISKIKGFGGEVLNGLKSFFGIHSPSKVMEEQVGKQLALGVAEGITKNKKNAEKSAEEMGQLIVNAAEKKLDRQKTFNGMSTAAEVAYWRDIYKSCAKGTEARLTAYKKYIAAKNQLAAEEQEAAEEQAAELQAIQDKIVTDAEDQLKKEKRIRDVSAAEEAAYWLQVVQATEEGSDARIAAEDKYYSALDSYKQQFDSYVSNIMNQMGLFDEFTVGDKVEGSSLISSLESQVQGMEDYYATLESLDEKIGDTALMDSLEEMGVDNLAELQAINNMSEEELQKYVALYDQKYQMAQDKAKEKLGEVSTTVQTETEASTTKTETELGKMATAFATHTGNMVTTTDKNFKKIKNAITKQMDAAVNAVVNAVNAMNAAMAAAPTGSTVDVKSSKVKAHAAGGILTRPTIFGYTPSTDTYHLGGEAGAEAVAPIDVLQGYVRSAVDDAMKSAGNDRVTGLLERMVELLQISAGSTTIELNGREFGRMVKEYA